MTEQKGLIMLALAHLLPAGLLAATVTGLDLCLIELWSRLKTATDELKDAAGANRVLSVIRGGSR